ncbi:aminotransferase class V-fold PLP-dependent enzyme [Herbiconiux sp. VKM Ac-1786]|uniref:kynureninase n=1 Tax=Herbiconiux sp. VKM Ac-1786 TaxID=2783824 RepID=UPI00188B957A|nr:aminotransferase class V-fold PLP-dependent enzyme [Herbiconiux sp. VKM Ac-1786]MBF4571767.1 aminotransferase class V-fold PLP-dependent enzyme [Herbiconiux sp. VKM Ac-1786]
MTASTSLPVLAARAAELDAADALAPFRDEFVADPGVHAYFDGNSLGRPVAATKERMAALLDAWGGRLIRGWDEQWMAAPEQVGDRIGALTLGAAPGQVVVGDSTTVLLYKLIRAAVAARPGRDEIAIDDDDFPTDRFLVESIARECGLSVRWIPVPRDGGPEPTQIEELVTERTALLLLSHVSYRSGHLADVETLTRLAHDVGALVLWDVCHSVGSVPTELDRWGVDLAVGCTYKYLNGGPGAPAFAYVRAGLQPELRQPITGWMGAADPFAMGEHYEPAAGIRRVLSGTPSILGMQPMLDMLDLIERAGMPAVRAKSVALTEMVVDALDGELAGLGLTLASPRDPSRRGGHVTLGHPDAQAVVARAWQRDVLPDYRAPGGIRIGLSPLSTSFAEVADGLGVIAECIRA